MTCPSCAEAEVNPLSGMYRNGCTGCQERALAGSPQYSEALRSGKVGGAYRQALQALYGDDWQAAHDRVKAWADRMQRRGDARFAAWEASK